MVRTSPARTAVLLPAMIAAAALAACQTEPAGGPLIATVDNNAAVAVLQKVNGEAHACWIRSNDRAFSDYRLIPELDTRVGKPRLLLVRARAAQGLPQLVIEAEGSPVRLTTYGPLAQGQLSARINTDVTRWATGGTGCKA
ncbi:hypothetical protein ACLB6G_16070 [Zhengella sp. ZM62]|uniref:hypothetical protein n=1 Tax=Zhengella sedimenti TaxID=3390035 RepID=UPI00397668F7